MAKVMFTARIEAEEEEFLKELGVGDRTAGFRLLLSRGMGGKVQAPAKPATPQLSAPVRRSAAPVARAPAPTVTPARKTGFIGRR